jgi:hypothetical protein
MSEEQNSGTGVEVEKVVVVREENTSLFSSVLDYVVVTDTEFGVLYSDDVVALLCEKIRDGGFGVLVYDQIHAYFGDGCSSSLSWIRAPMVAPVFYLADVVVVVR